MAVHEGNGWLNVSENVPFPALVDENDPLSVIATVPLIVSENVLPLRARGGVNVVVVVPSTVQPPVACHPIVIVVTAFETTVIEIDLPCEVVPVHVPSYDAGAAPA